MITVKQALEMALSPELNRKEKEAYDLICKNIDNNITQNFNGVSVTFNVYGFTVSGNTFRLNDYVDKEWRKDIVKNKWKTDYQNAGWFIEDVEGKDGYGYKLIKQKFSVDPSHKRDEKLEQLLSGK